MKKLALLFIALCASLFSAENDIKLVQISGGVPVQRTVPAGGPITGIVTSVNGQTGAVTVQPLPTYAALASDALTLGHDNITRTATLTGTKNLTLSSGGSTGDWRQLSFDMPGATYTVTTDFAVYRNGASSPATVSQDFTDHADITIINMGGGVYRWYDNLYGAQDQPVGSTPANYTPAADNTKAHLAAIDNALGVLGSTITGIDSAPIGMGSLWTTSDLANRPLNWLIADGTNGTPNGGTVGAMTPIIKGGGTVATPAISNGIIAGTYTGTQSVAVASATSGASLYYTFGSSPSDPTTSDTAVSGNISVASTGTLKVKAFKNLYTPSSVFSAAYTINPAFSYLISDNLDHVDSAAAVTAGWNSASAGYWGYATSPAPLGGYSYSLRTFWSAYVGTKTFTPQSEVWVYFQMNVPSVAVGGSVFTLMDAGPTTYCLRLVVDQAGVMSLSHLSTGSGSVTTSYSIGTTYHIWLHYIKGVGANTATIELYRSTDGIRGSALLSKTNAASTVDAGRINIGAVNNATVIFSKLRVSATAIGDNPL